VKLFVRSSTFDSKPGGSQLWRFKPTCDTGACDTALKGRVKFEASTSGNQARKKGGATDAFVAKLRLFGKTYGGRVTDFFATCGTSPSKDTWTFKIKVVNAKYVAGMWTVTKWEGLWTRDARFGVCPPGHLSAVIRGTLRL
jgi:hypothetical protein